MLTGLYSVIGKSIAVYENEDDFGLGGNDSSEINGNAGRILGCCNINSVPTLEYIDTFFK